MSDRERRRFHRVRIQRDATLADAGGEWPVVVEDISLKGVLLLLKPDEALDPAADYRLTISLSPEASIEMELELAHQEDGHAGFHCRHIDLDSIAHLRRLVELNSSDPTLLERDLGELASGLSR